MELHGFFTKKGLALSAKLLSGADWVVTKVLAGSGSTSANAEALAQVQQVLAVGSATRHGNTATLPVTLTAASASGSYPLTELGVYARDPDEGEILCKVYRLAVPAEVTAGSRTVLRFYLEETVAETAETTVLCSSAGLMTEADVDTAFLKRMTNGTANVHVAKSGSDNNGNGSESAPYLTIQKAVNSLPSLLLKGNANIVIHEGFYDEVVTLSGFCGYGTLRLKRASGETVQVKGISGWINSCPLEIVGIELTGTIGNSGENIRFCQCPRVYLENVQCTWTQESANHGAIRFEHVALVWMANCTISNKPIALDVIASTVYLNGTVSGTNNKVGIRCGSGWGSYGGFVQKGGAAIAGTETTGYGGQIY